MQKTLVRHGNSLALLIDKPILELLKIDENTPLDITTDGASLTLTPAAARQRARKFNAALKSVNRRYGPMLKRLA